MSSLTLPVLAPASDAADAASPLEPGAGSPSSVASSAGDTANVVLRALAALPLLAGCSRTALRGIAARAALETYRDGEELAIGDGVPMCVVVSGTVKICVSCGPSTNLVPGDVFNVVGMLGIGPQAERYRPAQKTARQQALGATTPSAGRIGQLTLLDSTAQGAQSGSGSAGTRAFLQDSSSAEGAAIRGPDHTHVFQHLCPHAAVQLTPETCGQKSTGWLRVTVSVGADGCTLAMLSRASLEDALRECRGSQLSKFRENTDAMERKWLTVLRTFLFPGAPPEVAWTVAEYAVPRHVVEGDTFTVEGEVGDQNEDLMIIESGEAVIEKLATLRGKAVPVDTGALGPGAIVGDISVLGAKIPRVATTRAKTPVDLLVLPRDGVLAVLRRFPGIIACMKARLREIAMMVQPSLPAKVETLSSLKIFSKCKPDFLRDVGRIAERRMFFCGDVVREEGAANGKFFVLDFGLCSAESREQGQLGVMSTGTSFGERTLLNPEAVANATIRVSSPLALMLSIQADSFHRILSAYPNERLRLGKCGEHGIGSADASQLEVLRRCGNNFVTAIAQAIETRCFLPGRAISVEGAIDAGSMFVIKGGRASIEENGRAFRELGEGVAFGELAMLGLVRRRTCTVRAMTFCFLQEIPRAAFLAALEAHPEEREHFEELTTRHGARTSVVRWPFFPNASSRIMYLVNLLAERRITQVGQWTSRSGDPLPSGSAVLVLQGTIELHDEDGNVLTEMAEGQCFNEQVLMGMPSMTARPVPTSSCEVQIMSAEVFERITKEFPDQLENARQRVVEELTGKAETKLKLQRGSIEIMRLSAIFRAVPDSFLEALRPYLKPMIFAPGEALTEEGAPGDTMYWLLDGCLIIGDEEGTLEPGKVIAEGAALGITLKSAVTVRAQGHCLVFGLEREILREKLGESEDVRTLLRHVFHTHNEEGLLGKLRQTTLAKVGPNFFDRACHLAYDAFFAPGDLVLKKGSACALGSCPMYVVLSGKASVEAEFEVRVGSVGPGEVFGEGGAMGVVPARTATVRADRKGGLLHCACLTAKSLGAAAEAFPGEYEALVQLFQRRQVDNGIFDERRRDWLAETVSPALLRSPIFGGFTKEMLYAIARQLQAVPFRSGSTIVTAGESADSAIILVGGEAQLSSKTGEVVGHVTKGAVLGEAALLGLLSVRTATLIAVTDCEVLTVTAKVLKEVLADPGPEVAVHKDALENLLASRHEQVRTGLPLSLLQTGVPADELCVRTVAVQAERLDLAPGDKWHPILDFNPNGPCVGVLAKGRTSLLVGNDTRPVMSVVGPALVPEGLAAQNGAYIFAVTPCEAYRFHLHDMQLATSKALAAKKWLRKFKQLLGEAESRMRFRLESAHGAAQSKVSKVFDGDLNNYKAKLQRTKERAEFNAFNLQLESQPGGSARRPLQIAAPPLALLEQGTPSRTSSMLGCSFGFPPEMDGTQRRRLPALDGSHTRLGEAPSPTSSTGTRSPGGLRSQGLGLTPTHSEPRLGVTSSQTLGGSSASALRHVRSTSSLARGLDRSVNLWRNWGLKGPSSLCMTMCMLSHHGKAGYFSEPYYGASQYAEDGESSDGEYAAPFPRQADVRRARTLG